MSTGLHARPATGFTVAEKEESFTRTESVVGWSRDGRAAYEAERREKPCCSIFFFFDRCKVFHQAGNYYMMRGDGDGSSFHALPYVFIQTVKRSLYF